MMKKIVWFGMGLVLAWGSAWANFSGSDDFNDNAMDANKWDLYFAAPGVAFTENNEQLEYTAPGTNGGTTAWSWVVNGGSYSNDWVITCDTAHYLDEAALTSNEVFIGLMVGSANSDNRVTIEHYKSNMNEAFRHFVGVDGTTADNRLLDANSDVWNDEITLRLAFDSQTKTIHGSYNEGDGFVPFTNFNVSAWGMTDADLFSAVLYTGTYGSGGAGADVQPGQVSIDNFAAGPVDGGFLADVDLEYIYHEDSGTDAFVSGSYSVHQAWWLGLENESALPVQLETVQFNANYALNVSPTPDSTVGNQHTWSNITVEAGDYMDFDGRQHAVAENVSIPMNIVRDWSPRVLTESGDVTLTITVTPQTDWSFLEVSSKFSGNLHDDHSDSGISFASLTFVGETHSEGMLENQWGYNNSHKVEWEVEAPTNGQPVTLTATVHYTLAPGAGPIAIEPWVHVSGALASDAGTESWTGGSVNLGAGHGSIQLSSEPAETDNSLPWRGVDLYSSATVSNAPQSWQLYDDFNAGSLDTNRWTDVSENSSAAPFVSNGVVRFNSTLNDGSCKIELTDAAVYGVQADFELSSASNDSGIELEFFLSDGGVGFLDLSRWNDQLVIYASVEDAYGEDLIATQWVGSVEYDTAYSLAVIVENGRVQFYVNDVLLSATDPIYWLTATEFRLGSWADAPGGTVVNGSVDNVAVLGATPPAVLSDYVTAMEIFAGYVLLEGNYEVEFEVESDGSLASVDVTAPFGSFSCEQDWDWWEYDLIVPANGSLPAVDGDWTVTATHTNGQIFTTVIPFAQANGTTPLAQPTSCPNLTNPDVSIVDFVFSTNAFTFAWDVDFDLNATRAGVGMWNAATDDDVDYEFASDAYPGKTYGPIVLEAGIEEFWIYNLAGHEGINADDIAFTVAKFAARDYDLPVIDESVDGDGDRLPNDWEIEFFGGITNAVAGADVDGDGQSNYEEYIAGFNPTNGASLFEITDPVATPAGFVLNWTAVTGRVYSISWTDDLVNGFQTLENYLPFPQNSYTDQVHSAESGGFYNVDVELQN